MTGYSFSTPVWDGGQWAAPEIAGATATARIVNGPEDQPRNAPVRWDKIDWRAQEEQVRRLRQRIFTASQAACNTLAACLSRVRGQPARTVLRRRGRGNALPLSGQVTDVKEP
jgi:hypothetical protein